MGGRGQDKLENILNLNGIKSQQNELIRVKSNQCFLILFLNFKLQLSYYIMLVSDIRNSY